MSLGMFALTDRVGIVTGAGRGIGEGIALALAEAGAHIVVAEIDGEMAQRTADEIRNRGRRALAIQTDVTSNEQVEAMVSEAHREFGKIDILVTSVGGNLVTLPCSPKVWDFEEKLWDDLISLNLKSVFLCIRAAGRIMKEQERGSIITLSSAGTLTANSSPSGYGAAKAAIRQFTQSLAVQCGPYGIRVNCIAPSSIQTLGFLRSPEHEQKSIKRTPLGRMGLPEDVGAAAVFLASDASSFVTGHTLVVDGGISLWHYTDLPGK